MTSLAPVAPRVSLTRIRAVALVRLRRLLRTRRLLLAAVMTLLPWFIVDQTLLVARLSALTEFTIVGLTVLGAGAVAEDLDGGQYAIALTHDCAPIELLAGEAATTLLLAVVLAAVQLPIALGASTVAHVATLLLCLGWLVALLAGWMSMMLLAATAINGVGNAVAMIPLLTVIPILQGTTILERLPASVSAVARFAVELLPTPQQATTMYEALLLGATPPRLAPIALLAAPIGFFALAAFRLARLEPARRLSV